jgi:hypothetical protein
MSLFQNSCPETFFTVFVNFLTFYFALFHLLLNILLIFQYLSRTGFFHVPSHYPTKLSRTASNLAISAVLTLQLWFSFHIRPSARHGLKFISGRHMRSKRRCSCVLQFTRLHAVSCVLHRPTSQVIHHSRLILSSFFIFCIYSLQKFDLYILYRNLL